MSYLCKPQGNVVVKSFSKDGFSKAGASVVGADGRDCEVEVAGGAE